MFFPTLSDVAIGSQHVKAKVFSTIEALLNVHGSSRVDLKVGGKTFPYVQGYKPYFLNIPDWNAIFFVTDDNGRTPAGRRYHIFSMKTHEDLSIHPGMFTLGDDIGNTYGYSDTVEQVTDMQLWLLHKGYMNFRCIIDLKAKSASDQVIDKDGK